MDDRMDAILELVERLQREVADVDHLRRRVTDRALAGTAAVGAPTGGNHKRGELYLDKNGALYLCKTAGTPGTWKLIG